MWINLTQLLIRRIWNLSFASHEWTLKTSRVCRCQINDKVVEQAAVAAEKNLLVRAKKAKTTEAPVQVPRRMVPVLRARLNFPNEVPPSRWSLVVFIPGCVDRRVTIWVAEKFQGSPRAETVL